MKALALVALSLVSLTLAACGGNSHEAIANQVATQYEALATTFEGIKDKATWDAAKPKLDKILTTMGELSKKMKAMGEPDAEANKEAGKKIAERMSAAIQKMTAATTKLMTTNKDLAPEIGKFMKDMGEKMGK